MDLVLPDLGEGPTVAALGVRASLDVAMSHQCGPRCTSGWTPGRKCHCRLCGNDFSTVTHFDKHLEKNGLQITCLDPLSLGLQLNNYGAWIRPGEVDFSARSQAKS